MLLTQAGRFGDIPSNTVTETIPKVRRGEVNFDLLSDIPTQQYHGPKRPPMLKNSAKATVKTLSSLAQSRLYSAYTWKIERLGRLRSGCVGRLKWDTIEVHVVT
jgi:hypothetical protein